VRKLQSFCQLDESKLIALNVKHTNRNTNTQKGFGVGVESKKEIKTRITLMERRSDILLDEAFDGILLLDVASAVEKVFHLNLSTLILTHKTLL